PAFSTLSLHDALPISVAALLPLPAVALRHDRQDQQVERVVRERVARLALDFALGPENRRLTHPQVQVGGPRLDQRPQQLPQPPLDRKSTRLNSNHRTI